MSLHYEKSSSGGTIQTVNEGRGGEMCTRMSRNKIQIDRSGARRESFRPNMTVWNRNIVGK